MRGNAFKIKIISASRLVLVECEGFGQEIFKPEVVNGRIQLINIVKQRRCCATETSQIESKGKINIISATTLKNLHPLKKTDSCNSPGPERKSGCHSKSEEIKNSCSSQIAGKNKSTSTTIFAESNKKKGASQTSLNTQSLSMRSSNSTSSSASSTQYPEPEILRDAHCQTRVAQHWQIPLNFTANGSGLFSFNQPSFIPHGPVFKTPQKISEPAPTFITPQKIPNRADKNISKLPAPKLGPNVKVIRLHRKPTEGTPKKVAKVVPLNSTFKGQMVCSTPKNSNKRMRQETPGTVTKWRKVITPARTYSKFPNAPKQEVKRSIKKGRGCSEYLKNSTVGCRGNAELQFRRVLLKIDTKKAISPKEFKQQLICTSDLRLSSISNLKTKRDYFNAKLASFDLLTNPCRLQCYGNKLHQMFRKRCWQKFAGTDPKYRHLLDDIPVLTDAPLRRYRCTI